MRFLDRSFRRAPVIACVGGNKSMRAIVFLSLISFLFGCGSSNRIYEIKNVTKNETINLKKGPNKGNIHALSISGSGNIDGTAEISLILNEKPYKHETISGSFNFKWSGDWYSNEAKVQYSPHAVSKGTITIRYKFHDL